ncbi:L-serine ammonia-lyase, iron-sulfur-dependent, subunit alpha [Arcanobacterium haemolyticum]|nr:L-serine ammonia-lyase, iron-sulfur-dependent, subunit alpha [Arcanobacterium haemolyticum]
MAQPTSDTYTSEPAAALRPLSIFDMFSIGIGPSSSHTVGPMRAGLHFASELAGALSHQVASSQQPGANASAALGFSGGRVTALKIDLMGSLGATGRGHATDRAVLLGLAGHKPDSVPASVVVSITDSIASSGVLDVAGVGPVPFVVDRDVSFLPEIVLPYHVNGVTMTAWHGDEVVLSRTYYSVGGGFVMQETGDAFTDPRVIALDDEGAPEHVDVPFPYSTARELLDVCRDNDMKIWEVVEANELAAHSLDELDAYIAQVWHVMQECIEAGCEAEGFLPGWLQVRRRAHSLREELERRGSSVDPLVGMDWVNLYALAVNEENAAGHRVVTAPTNGAAGVVPAVLMYWSQFVCRVRNAGLVDESVESLRDALAAEAEECDCAPTSAESREFAVTAGVRRFLLAATAIGGLIKSNASIAGAEVGCQGEVGSASAMAAAGLAEAMGGSPLQVENAAEIAMEHSLGLTCDPVGGLVQIPCIERNAIAAVKAINAARMALWGDGRHVVSLDTVIETMRQTGVDMLSKYKETSQGGLAVHIVEC